MEYGLWIGWFAYERCAVRHNLLCLGIGQPCQGQSLQCQQGPGVQEAQRSGFNTDTEAYALSIEELMSPAHGNTYPVTPNGRNIKCFFSECDLQ